MKRCIRPLRCPVCGERLTKTEKSLHCPQGHLFDIAREGYVNLLLSSGNSPKHMGDTKEMLRARRRFLETGAFAPLLDPLQRWAAELIAFQSDHSSSVDATIVDVGCGEGYYLRQLQQSMGSTTAVCRLGIDVAKTAVKMAARRSPTIQFIVADVWRRLPIGDGEVNLLLNIFAPRHAEEFHRVLGDGGFLLTVIPGSAHLQSLRAALPLLSLEADKLERVQAKLAPFFSLQRQKRIRFGLTLSGDTAVDLAQMGPSGHHLEAAQLAEIRQTAPPHTEACFHLLLFQKADGNF